jgi:hypothetical protein
MGKIKKTAFTEMDFIQKLRNILPSLDRRFKDESLIFITSINMFQELRKL